MTFDQDVRHTDLHWNYLGQVWRYRPRSIVKKDNSWWELSSYVKVFANFQFCMKLAIYQLLFFLQKLGLLKYSDIPWRPISYKSG